METWNQDPRQYLVMHLKLREGVQFANSSGKIETSLPEVVEPTSIDPWQYRLMLSLDGQQQFVGAVKEVKERFPGEFEAGDVWTFLYWLVDNELLEEADKASVADEAESMVALPEVIKPDVPGAKAGWMKVPLQVLAILVVCSFVMYASYKTTPMLIAFFESPKSLESDPLVELAVEAEKIQETRRPAYADAEVLTFASAMVQEVEPEVVVEEAPMEPTLVDRLMEMREEMAACQVRRDEYYLLNDEEGYSREVEKISILAREIGQIRADLITEAKPLDELASQ